MRTRCRFNEASLSLLLLLVLVPLGSLRADVEVATLPIVNATGIGVLCDPADPVDIARAIKEIIDAPDEQRSALRMRCLDAARSRYSWDHQVRELLTVYRDLGAEQGLV